MLLAAGWAVSEVSLVVWVLDVAQVVVPRVVATVFVAVIGCDVEAAVGGSGHETRGCRVCKGAVCRLGSVCRRSRGAGGSFDSGEQVVVVVVNNIGRCDGGCVDVGGGDVAVLAGKVTRVVGARELFSVWVVVSSVLGATWVLASLQVVDSESVWIPVLSRRTPRHRARVCSCTERHRPSP